MAGASARCFVAVLALAMVANASATWRAPQYASVAEAVSKTKSLSTLLSLVSQANLVSALGPDFNGTVFAPLNTAFAKLPEATLKAVTSDNALLTKVLTYHVSAVQCPKFTFHPNSISTLAGTDLTLSKKRTWWWFSTLFVKGKANAHPTKIMARIRAGKAFIYVIDDVLLPA